MSVDVANLVNPLGFVSDLAEGLVEGFTQNELLGDVVALGLDLAVGNWPKALQHGLELGQDVIELAEKNGARPPSGDGRQVAGTCPEPAGHYMDPGAWENGAAAGSSAAARHGPDYAAEGGYHGRPAAGPAGYAQPSAEGAEPAPEDAAVLDPTGFGRQVGEALAGVLGLIEEAKAAVRAGPAEGYGTGSVEESGQATPGRPVTRSADVDERAAEALSSTIDELDTTIDQLLTDIENGHDTQRTLTDLQLALQKRSQMVSLLTNIMSMSHETSMAIIGSIR